MKWIKLNESGHKFKTTLVKGGGNSFCEALRNTNNNFDIGIDKVAKEICEEFGQECVLVKDYETNQIYFIDANS